MPAYHSSFVETDCREVGNVAILPFNTKARGPALPHTSDHDIVSEALNLFRSNVLFRNYEIHSSADRLLIYLILFISDCLSKLNARGGKEPRVEAAKHLNGLATGSFALPGEAGFPLNNLFQGPANRNEADFLRQYLQQARQETVNRLILKLYMDPETGRELATPSKWWMAFSKRKFMNKTL